MVDGNIFGTTETPLTRQVVDRLQTDRDKGIAYVTHLVRDGYDPECPTCVLAVRWAALHQFADASNNADGTKPKCETCGGRRWVEHVESLALCPTVAEHMTGPSFCPGHPCPDCTPDGTKETPNG